jgi:hypothetical protein
MTQSIQRLEELELLKQLIGEWAVGIGMKEDEEKIVSKWLSRDLIEAKEIHSNLVKVTLIVNYIIKRKEG